MGRKAMVGNMIRVLRARMTLLAVDEAGCRRWSRPSAVKPPLPSRSRRLRVDPHDIGLCGPAGSPPDGTAQSPPGLCAPSIGRPTVGSGHIF
jgi:hypothetical protein